MRFFKYLFLFIYLAKLGLSCSTQNLLSLFQHVGSLIGSSSPAKDGTPPLEAQHLSHWTIKEVLIYSSVDGHLHCSVLFSITVVSISIPTNSIPGFPFLPNLANLIFVVFGLPWWVRG